MLPSPTSMELLGIATLFHDKQHLAIHCRANCTAGTVLKEDVSSLALPTGNKDIADLFRI